MPKTLNEASLSTPNARKALPEGNHWRGINADVHLGYRKQKRGGRWMVRWYRGDQKYKQVTIGTADDGKMEANGVDCLSFEQAKTKAAKVASQSRADEIASADGPAPTVGSAVLASHCGRRMPGRKLWEKSEAGRSSAPDEARPDREGRRGCSSRPHGNAT